MNRSPFLLLYALNVALNAELMSGTEVSVVVAKLADLAGFDFAPERCELLAPQLEWLLAEARRIDDPPLTGLEPVSTFQPAEIAVAMLPARGDAHE